MPTPIKEQEKRPKPVRRTRRRNPRFRAFFQSLAVIPGFFDGEELVGDLGFRIPATLSSKSTITPGTRGDFVCYLRSDIEQPTHYSSVELVRLRGENDPHVSDLTNGGFVAGHVHSISKQSATITVHPDRRHKTPPFNVTVHFLSRRPKKLMRQGKLVCYRFEIDEYGLAVFHSCFVPPRPTPKPAKESPSSVAPIHKSKPRPIKAVASVS